MSGHPQDRRSAILEAVIGLLAEERLAGVTHRAADLTAGPPQGSSSYYFPRKSALIRSAAARLADELWKDCGDLRIAFAEVAARQGLEAAIDHAAQGLIASAAGGKRLLLARIEFTMAAARDEGVADMGHEMAAAARRPIEFFVGLISKETSAVPVETDVGLIDGVALLHATGQGPGPTTDQVTTVLQSLTRGDGSCRHDQS